MAIERARNVVFPQARDHYDRSEEQQFRAAAEREMQSLWGWVADSGKSVAGSFIDNGGAVFNVKHPRFGATGDGVTDDADAIEAAINAAIAAGGGKVLFPNTSARYFASRKITVTEVGGSLIHLAGGHGVGSIAQPMIQFDGDDSGFEWAANADGVKFSDLVISHTTPAGFNPSTLTNVAPLAGYGTGIKMATANYVIFDNVWVEYFNVGVELTGFSFYSTFRNLRCHYNYSRGFYANPNALLNGDPFEACQFSNTLNGPGFEGDLRGAAPVTFRNTYFEHNETEGLRAKNFIALKLDSCYFEQNAGYDVICENLQPHMPSMLHLDDVYIDIASRNSAGEPRIYLEGTPFVAVNCRLYSTDGDGSNPIFVARSSESGQQSVAIGCVYDSATLTQIPGDEGIIVLDHKHPYVGFAAAQPEYPTSVKAGSVFFNTDEASAAGTLGWRCVTGGAGLAQGPAGTAFSGVTGSTTNGSNVVTVSVTTHPVIPGDYIQINGVTFGAGENYARVEEVIAGPTLILDRNALNTVVSGAMQYRVATWQTLTVDGSGFVKSA